MNSPNSLQETLSEPQAGCEVPTDHGALQAFDVAIARTEGFRVRPGQREMAAQIARHLGSSDALGADKQIAVIQAGTGVGKSAAYLSTAIALALVQKKRLVVSTATVALQEQLMSKDLPAMAKVLDTPFEYALAKGRARYACKLKLQQLAAGAGLAEEDLLDEEDGSERPGHTQPFSTEQRDARQLSRAKLYANWRDRLDSGVWDGDKDQLPEQPEGAEWLPIAADRHGCAGRHCPVFRSCVYFQARSRLTQVQVIVANHDLVLASIGRNALPELDKAIWVFDEAHHLPGVALEQFSASMSLTALRWLDQLPKAMQDAADALAWPGTQDTSVMCAQIKAVLSDLARLCMDIGASRVTAAEPVLRFAHGVIPPALQEPLQQVQVQADALSAGLEDLAQRLKERAKDEPSSAQKLAVQYARLGRLASRLDAVTRTTAMLLAESAPPAAKWLSIGQAGGLVTLRLHASPLLPGDLLHQHLWQPMRQAVLTSASLTSCATFDYFLEEVGLLRSVGVATLSVHSPFDYAQQGTLEVVHTRADPKQVTAYTAELMLLMRQDLRQIRSGALVLFTSRQQMATVVAELPSDLRGLVLIQGQQSRARLLQIHQERVAAGQPSILFGLQSFGEGLDLPGALCETLLISKLPFASPSDPVWQARAEWMQRQGRDPFSELVVPATGLRLLQWTGRAIRSENDRARVICYDKRLVSTAFGRRMLSGLPNYALVERRDVACAAPTDIQEGA